MTYFSSWPGLSRHDERDLKFRASPGAFDPFRGRFIFQHRHLVRAPRQHRALVDVALVGDFAAVDRAGSASSSARVACADEPPLWAFSFASLRDRCATFSWPITRPSGAVSQSGMGAAAAMFGNTRKRA